MSGPGASAPPTTPDEPAPATLPLSRQKICLYRNERGSSTERVLPASKGIGTTGLWMVRKREPISIGSRFRTIQSPVVPIPFDAGNTRSVELPRSFLYKQIFCRLRGSVAGAGSSGVVGGADAPGPLIKRLDLIADGRKLLQSVAGVDAFRLSNLFQ